MAQTPSDTNGGTTVPGSTILPGTALTASDLQHFIFWSVGAVALIVLADFLPRQTILLTGVIGLSVVFRFNTQLQAAIASVEGTATGTMPSTTSTSGPAENERPNNLGGANSSGLGSGRKATSSTSNVLRYPRSPFMRDLIRKYGKGA